MRKTINQWLNEDGSVERKAVSAPDWYIHDGVDIQVEGHEQVAGVGARMQWAPPFSEVTTGNEFEHFVTGEKYFHHVAQAIINAKKSIFITGWQVDYDVLMPVDGGYKPLLLLLDDAVKRGNVDVFVMPWLSPKKGVNTHDFPTMLAIAHLNGASAQHPKGPPGRARCLPAMLLSDQQGLFPFFSHHQKCVVIDNEIAYLGGIDLAYGRRDDGNFSLAAGGRDFNELYNPCIPAIGEPLSLDLQHFVNTKELLVSLARAGWVEGALTWWYGQAEGKWAQARDVAGATATGVRHATAAVKDWWSNADLFPQFLDDLHDKLVDAAQGGAIDVADWTWERLDPDIRARIERMRKVTAANAEDAGALFEAWLNGIDLSAAPPEVAKDLVELLGFLLSVLAIVNNVERDESFEQHSVQRYEPLFEKVRMVPDGPVRVPDFQPRMPWHDVHCCVRGPAVFHLAHNFIERWNTTADFYNEKAKTLGSRLGALPTGVRPIGEFFARILLGNLWVANLRRSKVYRFEKDAMPHIPPAQGSCRVQVLRSMPLHQLRSEQASNRPKRPAPALAQNNCLKAMLRAIRSATRFIYIEGQFFQSAYGADGPTRGEWSGPVGALLDIRRSPGYMKFAERLEIKDVAVVDIPRRIRFSQLDDVLNDPDWPAFKQDLDRVLANLALVDATRALKAEQEHLHNPVGKALANRIARAIAEGRAFHVYIVLPVHPEGTLDTPNVVNQVHLTMHSLVHGERSLVNEVRRAIHRDRLIREEGKSPAEARVEADAADGDKLEEKVGDAWKDYLTLLNLRNWATLAGRPVTEQVYVHSKLLIADDRVAIIGSANINDRSLWGDRDSELAAIITDTERKQVPLAGYEPLPVGARVHALRRALWTKLFGGMSRDRRAPSLLTDEILDQPANPATWRAIQKVADRNARFYEQAFWYIPRSNALPQIQAKEADDKDKGPPASSLWPVWRYKRYMAPEEGGALLHRMPFEPLFWRDGSRFDVGHTWQASPERRSLAPEAEPEDIQGFITALPVRWTRRENNDTPMNLTVLAGLMRQMGEPGTRSGRA